MFAKPIQSPHPQQALATTQGLAMPSGVRQEVEVHTSLTEFCALAQEWERLCGAAPARSPFNTWMWHYAWWDGHRAKRTLRIAVARRGGVVTGIVPLYVDTVRKCGVRVQVLRLLGTLSEANPYDVAPLIDREAAPASARALADALVRMDGYDVLELADLE